MIKKSQLKSNIDIGERFQIVMLENHESHEIKHFFTIKNYRKISVTLGISGEMMKEIIKLSLHPIRKLSLMEEFSPVEMIQKEADCK